MAENRWKLEVCVDHLRSVRPAIQGGADRLEVCAGLALGGITPGPGLIEACVSLQAVPVMMMVRPHGGSFLCGPDEVSTMLRDIEYARNLGVAGVVLGALTREGTVDVETCRRLIDAARPLAVTFHRAFDLCADPLSAFDDILELGCERLLTSGQASTALSGAGLIKKLVERAGDRLIVVAGGGVRAGHVAELARRTGVRELHASASRSVQDSFQAHPLGLVHPAATTTESTVRALASALGSLADAP